MPEGTKKESVGKVVELCCGLGGATHGLLNAGLDVVKAYDLWPVAVQAHKEWHPEVPCEVRDVKEIEPEELRGVAVWASLPCFVAGTLVLTDGGYRPIEDIKVGDMVLTHEGRWRPVQHTMRREGAQLRYIKAGGAPEGLLTTDEHPFYVRQQGRAWNNDRRSYDRTFGLPEWRDAEDVVPGRDLVGQVLPAEDKASEYSEAHWWLVGRYLADGWRTDTKGYDGGSVVVCAGASKAAELERRIIEAGFTPRAHRERTVTKFHIFSNDLYHFLKPFGRYAHGKCIPGFALELPKHLAKALLDGYLSGDGHYEERYKELKATTVSRPLALGVALLAQKVFGVVAAVRVCRVPRKKVIEGRQVNQRDFYVVSIPHHNRSAFVDGDYGWKHVRENMPAGVGTVYNISVEEDESYVVENIIVHNCQPWSVANQVRRGKNHPHYYSLRHFARQVQYARVAVIENVAGLARTQDGRAELQELRDECRKLGLRCSVQIISCTEHGVVTAGKRTIIIISRDGQEVEPIVPTEPVAATGRRPTANSGQQTLADGTVTKSLYTVQQSAELQGVPVPSGYGIVDQRRLIGNAVPPRVAEAIARQVIVPRMRGEPLGQMAEIPTLFGGWL
ncbi:DNA cytosine methyltransferase [Deinococcus fonticola]|uniref:DNA cytosine methyltransferase n=1 Tax=Deinococcus fonticola TaxID=2528713 RepID=UPI001074F503|nr:DNA cytosine methyltransferase [Deinococcus fonticola]